MTDFGINHFADLYEALGLDVDASGEDLANAIADVGRVREALQIYSALVTTLVESGWEFRLQRSPEAPMEDRWRASVHYRHSTPLAAQSAPDPLTAIKMLLERLPGRAGVSREEMQRVAAEASPPVEWATLLVVPSAQQILRQSSGVHPAARVKVVPGDSAGLKTFTFHSTLTGLTLSDPCAYDEHDLSRLLRYRMFVEAKGHNTLMAVPSQFASHVLDEPVLTQPLAAPLPDASPHGCPDDGTCHHRCPMDRRTSKLEHPDGLPCWRVLNAGPLSGVFPGDEWPEATREYHQEAQR